MSVTIEVDRIVSSLSRVFVLKGFDSIGGIVDGVARPKETPEFFDEVGEVIEPVRERSTIVQGTTDFTLEPIERDSLEIRQGEGHLSLIVREVSFSRGDVHRKLEDNGFQLRGICTVEDVRNAMMNLVPWFRRFGKVPNL